MAKQTSTQAPNRTTYKPFYLVMLILTTIGVAFSTWGIFEALNLIIHFSAAPVYASLMLLSIALLPLSIIALILLYQKQKAGLVLLYISLASTFVIAIALLFFSNQMIDYTLATTTSEDIDASGGLEFFTSFMTIFWYVALIAGNILVIASAVLWNFAWRNQHRLDKK